MHDINKAIRECVQELDDLGIHYGNIREFKINTRAKKRLGQCKKNTDGTYTIDISHRLLDETIDLKYLKSTIIHEILHSCKGCMNHGDKWKMYAQAVNETYGYNIKRTILPEELNLPNFNTSVGLYSHEAVNSLINKYVSTGGQYKIFDSGLILCFGTGLKTAVIHKKNQGYTVRMYNKTPMKYQSLIFE